MGPAVAWGGGAAFVGSLAYFVYTYAVTLGDPTWSSGSAPAAAAIDCALFALFAAHHSLFARPRVKRLVTRLVAPALERSFFVWTASLLLILACAAWQPIPGSVYRHTGALALVHVGFVALGVLLTALGARLLDPLDLAGIRQALRHQRTARRTPAATPGDAVPMRGPLAEPASARDDLVTGFPYNLVRHPIYLGWVLIVFGVPHMTWNRLLMAALSTAYLAIAVPWEERLLVNTFGSAYEAYRRRVRWRIVPFVY